MDVLDPGVYRYAGKSSEFKLISFAINAKETLVGESDTCLDPSLALRDDFWKPQEVSVLDWLDCMT